MTLADPAIHSSLVQVRNAIKDMEKRLYDHGERVAQAFRKHGDLINEQTKIFATAADRIVEVQHNWDDAFTKLNESAAVFEKSTKTSLDQLRQGFSLAASRFQEMLHSLGSANGELVAASKSLAAVGTQSEEHWTKRFEAFTSYAKEQDRKFEQWSGIASEAFEAIRQQMTMVEKGVSNNQSIHQANASTTDALLAAIGSLEKAISNSTAMPRQANSKRWPFRPFISLSLAFAILLALMYGDPSGLNVLREAIVRLLGLDRGG